MKRAITGLSDVLDRLCQVGAVSCFAAMLVFVAIQVVARYLLQSPPTWTEELARFAMVWGGLLGATVSFKARFDPVLIHPSERDSPMLTRIKVAIASIAVAVFICPVLYFSLFGPGFNPDRGFLARSALRTADTLGFPLIYVAAAVPFAAAVILLHLASRFAEGRPGGKNGT